MNVVANLNRVKNRITFYLDMIQHIGIFRFFMHPFYKTRSTKSVLDLYKEVKAVALVGRGKIMPSDQMIRNVQIDRAVCLNFVNLKLVPKSLLDKIDSQQCQPPPPIAVFKKSELLRNNVTNIISNKRRNSPKLKRFLGYYWEPEFNLYHYPEDSELTMENTNYSVYAPTQTGSALKVLFNCHSVTKIYLFGIDFFMTGYSHAENHQDKYGPMEPNQKNVNSKGKPLIEYIRIMLPKIRKERDLEIYVSLQLKEKFNDIQGVKYY